jgi:PTS system nitrogen regulatory IIA component
MQTGEAMTTHEIMTVEEVAEYLRVSISHVQKQARLGNMPAFKMGYLWRFRRSELDMWSVSGLSSRAEVEQ